MPIYTNNNVEISKKKNKYQLTINDIKARHFWNTTINIIDFKEKKTNKNMTITFEAHSIETLPSLLKSKSNKLSTRHVINLFKCFLKQINSLEKDNLGINNLDLNDFIIVNKDETRFNANIIFINSSKFIDLKKNFFLLKTPSEINNAIKGKFISPELKNNKNIPFKLHKSTIYYSIGQLLTYCINNENLLDEKKDFELSLESIYDSKIYYAIMRCVEINPRERYYLYI